MIGAHPSVVVRVVSALLAPFIAVFGLYIIAHGHYGPGGGFAGGVFLAVAAILPRLTLAESTAYRLVPSSIGPLAGGIGVLGYLLIGIVPLLLGGSFLDYGVLAIGDMEPARARYLGILFVEIAVGLAVFGAMLLIFDTLTGRTDLTGHDTVDAPAAPDMTPQGGPQ
jgi:multicomponent Na+:H+ antiporter subunit B